MTKAKATPSNIWHYLLGKMRYKLYYSKAKFLMGWHIQDQIEMRIKLMDTECYNNGSCKKCGCMTTALQMANKACDKPCYPPMLGAQKWMLLASGEEVTVKEDTWKLTVEKRKYTGTRHYSETIYYIYKNSKLVHTKIKND